MLSAISFLALLSAAAGALSQTVSNVSSSACPSNGGAHVIVARASTEAYGYGTIGAVKDVVLSRVPGSTAEAVSYPATLTDYVNSETSGVLAMRALISAFIAKCPCAPLVLMGYSQGAQVTMDSLVGQDVAGFPMNLSTPLDMALPTATLARTAAVVVMGDPSFNTNETFHVGNATKSAIFPRENVDSFAMTGLGSRIQSYCDALDPYCASGSFDNISVHTGYTKEYGMAAADFVVSQLKTYQVCANGTSGGNGTTGGASPSSSSPAYTGGAQSLGAAAGIAMLGSVFALLL